MGRVAEMSGNSLTRFKSNLNKGVVGIKWSILITLEESSIYMMEHLNFRAIPISQRRSRVKCLTHTLLRVVMLESESLIIRGKLKGLTVLRALSARLMKSDISASLVGLNLRVSCKSRRKLYKVFKTNVYENIFVDKMIHLSL